VLIVVPIMLPLVQKLGIDLVWFCTLVAVCLQTAWLSPPVALSAYFLKGVVPDWELSDIYAGMMQFMVLQVVGLLLLLAFPADGIVAARRVARLSEEARRGRRRAPEGNEARRLPAASRLRWRR
jgi:TRAP-type mannitol/chloroaromatic compound transport system permease large subunit